MIEIKDHFLYIDGVRVPFKKTPNIASYKNKLQYLVEHYTATYSSSGPISWLCDRQSAVSAHLVVAKDGKVTQLAPFDAVCWHAGASKWKGIDGLNSYSIGIEIVNSGILKKKGDSYFSADGHEVTDHVTLTNKLGLTATWEKYPDVQIDSVAAISQALQSHYSLKEIIGHEDISPGRKTDPGPAFPWERIKAQTSVYPKKSTTADLNVRDAPEGKVIMVLKKGTSVNVLKEQPGWTFIGHGWVATRYLI